MTEAELVESALDVARIMATKMCRRVPGSISFDDLYAAALGGLARAARKFEPERGLAFRTYAPHHVRGAMLDLLRENDYMPRARRERASAFFECERQLTQELGRFPNTDELAAAAGVTPQDVEAFRAQPICSLDDVLGERDGGGLHRRHEQVAASEPSDPDAGGVFALAARGLSWKEQAILRLYYWEKLSMRQIAEQLDLTESRISQWHAEILARLGERSLGYWYE